MAKPWLGSAVQRLGGTLKAFAALVLGIGTVGLSLTVIGVTPASAVGVPVVTTLTPISGLPAGGTSVTIAGTTLGNATAVDFGTNAGIITTNTSQKIVVTSPAGTDGTTVNVTVTTAGGTSVVNANSHFSYVDAPTVTALYGGDAPVNGTNSIIVQGTNFVANEGTDAAGSTVKFGSPTVTIAATSITVLNSTQIEAVVPAEPASLNTTPPTTYNVTVTTGSGVTATSTASNFYWFGGGTCAFTGGTSTNTPPGSTAYLYNATPGTTVIPTTCSGLSGLALLAPFVESLSDPEAAIVTASPSCTCTSGVGGNEAFLGYTGDNNYFSISGSTYTAPEQAGQTMAGYVIPSLTTQTGGCPIGSYCSLAVSENQAADFGADPNGTCPPSQAQVNAGLIDCSIAAVVADQYNHQYVTTTLDLSYANQPTPANPTATMTPSTGLSAGQTVTINSCNTCNWWGAGQDGAPSYVPSIATGLPTQVTAPAVWVGTTRSTAVQATSSINITPATYVCSSGGASVVPPTPTVSCTLGQGTITGSFTVPSGLSCTSCNVYIDEPNISLQPGNYSGSGTYNVGMTYNLVNAVESSTNICIPSCGSTPTVSGVSPSSGAASGTQPVTITGSGFTGATAVNFGGSPATNVTVVSDSQITATSPAGTGTVDVTVVTPGGTSATSSADHYTYVNAPTVTSISPTSGPAAGSTAVTINGTGFTGETAVHFGGSPATNVTVVSDSQITATSPAGTGTVDVTVVTPGGTSATSSADHYTYVNAPTVTSISPTSGPAAGSTAVTINGTGFTGETAVNFGGSPATNVTVVSDSQITATSPAGTGTVDVTVVTPNGTSATSANDQFTYINAPTVTAVSPASGAAAGGSSVTVTGTNFTGASIVEFGGSAAATFSVDSNTQITATSPAGTGTVDITVTAPGGTSSTSASDHFTYVNAPTVTAVGPSSGPAAGGTQVTITGTAFTGATAVYFGAASASFTVNSDTEITATTPGGSGSQDVVVVTPYGSSSGGGPVPFTYIAAPVVSNVNPSSGPAAGGTSVTVGGTGFTGATAVNFGGVPGTGVTVVSATQITVSSPAGSGTVDVTVTTPGGTSATSANDQFTFIAAPTVSGVSPSAGPASGGTSVTVSGSGLTGATSVDFGSTPATGFNVVSDTQITATSPGGSGTVDVTVTTPGGTSATSANDQFTFIAAPTVSGVSPSAGPASGGTSVTVSGSGLTGATSVDFGSTPATGFNVVSDTQITATSPGGSGTVDITVVTPGGTTATTSADQYVYNNAPSISGISPATGLAAGGTAVTITGTGFTDVSDVTFGSSSATGVTVVSSTEITATSPAGSGTVDVTVTSPDGTSATSSADQFSYIPVPTVTGVTPSSGPGLGGTSVIVAGTGLTGATAVDFGSTPAATFTVNTDNQITATSPFGSGAVDVTVVTPGGTSATTDSDLFTFEPAPSVSGISPSSGPEIGGTAVTVSGSGFAGATAVDFGGTAATNVTVVSSSEITATSPAGSGTVDVTVTSPNGVSTTGSADQFTYTTTPVAPSVTSVSPSSGASGGGTSVTVDGSGFTGATAVDFGGNAASGVTVVSDNQITAISPAGSGTVDVTVTTPNGVSATGSADQFTYTTGCSQPTITSADAATVVVGTPVTFTVTTCSATVPVLKVSHLVKGLAFVDNHDGTGTISGTPAVKDHASYASLVSATVRGQPKATQSLDFTVNQAPIFKSHNKLKETTGVAFAFPVTTDFGNPAPVLTSSTLPDGLTLTDNGDGTGVLGGTAAPLTGGIYVITLTAANGIGAPVSQTFTLTLYQPAVITSADSDSIAAGVAMTPFTVSTTGYPTPKLRAVGLPMGVHLSDNRNGTGTIAGTPKSTAAGTYNVSIEATNHSGMVTQSFTLTVTP